MLSTEMRAHTIHGSPSGYTDGCRSRGGCPNQDHPTLMTCVDANAAARSDWQLAHQPRTQPIPRAITETPAPEPQTIRRRRAPRRGDLATLKHGTVHGYNQGCRSIDECPNHATDTPTCLEEHRRYYREYFAALREDTTREIPHGTETGYSYGCRDRESCPGDDTGTTCPDAARTAEQRRRGTSRQAAA